MYFKIAEVIGGGAEAVGVDAEAGLFADKAAVKGIDLGESGVEVAGIVLGVVEGL